MGRLGVTGTPYGESDAQARALAELSAEGLRPQAWANGPHERYPPHAHDYDKVLLCVEGSIVFTLLTGADGAPAAGSTVELSAGDRLVVPAGTVHSAVVGPAGVRCVEAPAS